MAFPPNQNDRRGPSEPPLPRLDSGFSGAPPRNENLWGPEPERSQPSKRSASIKIGFGVIMGSVVIAFLVAGVALGIYLLPSDPPEWEAAEDQVAAAPASWSVGSGPLVEGLQLQGEAPGRLRWSPDGREIGWLTVDPERGAWVATVVSITHAFGEPTEAEPHPDWLSEPIKNSEWTARLEHGLLVVRGPTRPEGQFVDLLSPLQLHSLSTPSLYQRGDRLWLAIVGIQGADAESPSLHVLELTRLVAAR